MKCIRCQHDSKYPERVNGICPGCKKPFCFEPRAGDPFSDGAFEGAIKRVSADGKVRFGAESVHYELARRLVRDRRKLRLGCLGGIAVCGGIATIVMLGNLGARVALPWAALLAALAGYAWFAMKPTQLLLDRDVFAGLFERWKKTHGVPPALIVRQEPPPETKKRPIEADLGDYSFDRAVICDRARTVDLLLANNFHFENNCAVLSIEGYPQRAFETVRTMLRRNPRIQVFALHDATADGCAVAHCLSSDPKWFKGVGRVVDVGLRPSHAQRFRGLWQARMKAPTASSVHGLRPDEIAWLEKWNLELAAIRPEQVIKRLYRTIAWHADRAGRGGVRATDLAHDDDDGVDLVDIVDDDDATVDAGVESDALDFGADADASDGGPDAFG